jgi:hypothetical protein
MADQIHADVDPHRELFERAEEFVRAALVAKDGAEWHYLYEQARQLQEEILDTPALSIVGALMKAAPWPRGAAECRLDGQMHPCGSVRPRAAGWVARELFASG